MTAFLKCTDGRIASLDGWRSIAVMLVLLGHVGLGQVNTFGINNAGSISIFLFQNNYALLGVRVFFVLSGFIITWILLSEKEKQGRISIRNFYWRRILRILPVFYCYILFLICINSFLNPSIPSLVYVKAFLFLSNFGFWGGHQLINHAWSLAVEEQYYLLWPLTLVLIPSRKKIIWVIVVVCLIGGAYRAMFYNDNLTYFSDFLFAGFFINVDAILIGSLLAIVAAQISLNKILNHTYLRRILLITALVSFCGIEYCSRMGYLGFITVPLGGILQSLAIAFLLMYSIIRKSFLFTCLNWKPLVTIGKWSFSIYVWQQFFLLAPTNLMAANNWTAIFFQPPYNLFFSIIAGFCSYHLIELPFLKIRKKYSFDK